MMANPLPVLRRLRVWQIMVFGASPRINPETFGSALMAVGYPNMMENPLPVLRRLRVWQIIAFIASPRINPETFGSVLTAAG
jgi:hypothetical protein